MEVEYKGKKVGSLVDLTCFSFNPVKNLGAMGDAGAVTGNKKLVDKVRMFRDHGRKTKFDYDQVGYNARIDNLQAVVTQAKLKKLDSKDKKAKSPDKDKCLSWISVTNMYLEKFSGKYDIFLQNRNSDSNVA